MASLKERKKEFNKGHANMDDRNNRRGKPLQQIYRPGSGPLRKSTSGIEESESDTNLVINSRQNQQKNYTTQDDSRYKSEGSSPRNKVFDVDSTTTNFGDMSIRDSQRRSKKPEQMIYVPPHAHRDIHPSQISNNPVDRNPNPGSYINGDDRNFSSRDRDNTSSERYNNKSKRYSNRRRNEDNYSEWREKSPSVQRQIRQGSEPRGASNGNNWSRSRDTRSVEPSNLNYTNSDKINSKPPSGRRHSTIGLEGDKRYKPQNLDHLAPRFRKLAESKLMNQIPVEDNWDGSSITFQGTVNTGGSMYVKMTPGNQYPNYATLPSGQMMHQNQPPMQQETIYCTMRNKGRGRGRLQHDYAVGPYRAGTPEKLFRSPCNSRPPTPPLFNSRNKSTDNLSQNQDNSRPQTPVNYHRNEGYSRNYDRYPEDKYNRNYQDDRYKRNGRGRQDRWSEDRDFNNSRKHRDDLDSRNKLDRNRNSDKFRSNKQQSGFRESLEAQLSPVSPETPEEKIKVAPLQDNNTILDWSEEVELNEQLEALSDALTRSSSVTSLVDKTTMSMPSTTNTGRKTRKNRKKSKRRTGSATRDTSLDNQSSHHHGSTRQNSYNSMDERDNFKTPQTPCSSRRRRQSNDKRDTSFDRFHNNNKSRNQSRDNSFDRNRRSSTSEQENWREEIRNSENKRNRQNSSRSRNNSEIEDIRGIDMTKGGVLVLPSQKQVEASVKSVPQAPSNDRPKYPQTRTSVLTHEKCLYDYNNPQKPIIVKSHSSRVSVPGFSDNIETPPPQMYIDQYGNTGPSWYDVNSEGFASCHYKDMITDIKKADSELQIITSRGFLMMHLEQVEKLRSFLREALEYLLCKDLKFCQTENVEHHLWKLLYYNIIEMIRKAITHDPDNKEQYKTFLLYLIDEGTKYFERLLERLEETYSFKLINFIGNNQNSNQKGQKYLKLALVSAQKLLLFLGDLARYREQVNETSNYGKCRQWYVKAQELNPKNGRPYNQLAVLAVYSRRKLDAVYYYMRSLMSSNPFPSAKESLVSLFDEIRKKYESERKRREERLERARQHMKQKESEDSGHISGSLRKETWIRPNGGRRVHRTTQAVQEQKDSEEEDLAILSSVEVNKRFVISYLHVHGKLITRIGIESFQETAMQMLKEFRALLQHSPVPLPCNRFLQLLALNMFAIDSTQLKDPEFQSQSGYRSELQERALVISLQMFSLILERCVSILQEHLSNNLNNITALPQDVHVLLPAIKIWCDWMLCHSSIWNPPPSTQDFKVGSPGDAWSRLAVLMNLLKQLDRNSSNFPVIIQEQREDHELVRLPEDSVLSGFTPLMVNIQMPAFIPKEFDAELAQFALRLDKLIFFGTEFLCGLEPPVLKLEIEDDFREYISVVQQSSNRDSPPSPRPLDSNEDVILESFSSDEEETQEIVNSDASKEIQELLTRKVELEKTHRSQELHLQRVKRILSQSVVSVHIEVRPKFLVPDTNCFIDHLDGISTIANSHVYTFMVPIVVLSELEGLCRGGKSPVPAQRSSIDPQHVLKVAESAKRALDYLKSKPAAVKCVTTKGAILSSTTFTTEDDSTMDSSLKNDDKILATCLVLGNKDNKETPHTSDGEPRQLTQEVVLLTDDRNLRVKALARDVPVRELPDFMQWAGLG